MNYKYLFAAFITAFILSIEAINAQAKTDTLDSRQFWQLVTEDSSRAFALALEQKLTLQQLIYFMDYENGLSRNKQYIEPLRALCWQLLSPKERLDYNCIALFKYDYSYYTPFDSQYNKDVVFQYVVENETLYKKAWGKEIYTQYLISRLLPFFDVEYNNRTATINTPLDTKIKNADLYLAQLKQKFPAYEQQIRTQMNYVCVYDWDNYKEMHCYWHNEYMINYVNHPIYLYNTAQKLIDFPESKTNYQYGIGWLDKAIKIKPDYRYYLLKAHLLYRTDKKEQAIKLLNTYERKIDPTDAKTIAYVKEIRKEIEKK